MTEITYVLGAVGQLVFAPKQPDGTMPDLTDLRMELRITAQGQCIVLHGTPVPEGFEVDLSELTLTPRQYPGRLYFIGPSGPGEPDHLFLNIEGGC